MQDGRFFLVAVTMAKYMSGWQRVIDNVMLILSPNCFINSEELFQMSLYFTTDRIRMENATEF